jgi:O-antigen ligase
VGSECQAYLVPGVGLVVAQPTEWGNRTGVTATLPFGRDCRWGLAEARTAEGSERQQQVLIVSVGTRVSRAPSIAPLQSGAFAARTKEKGMSASQGSWWEQTVKDKLVAMVLVMVVVVTLIASPLAAAAHYAPALVYEAMAIVLFATLLSQLRWKTNREKVLAFVRTGPNVPILLFLGWVAFSCARSVNAAALQEALRIGSGVLLYFVVAYHFRRSDHLSRLFDTLLFVGIVTALFGLAQFSMGGVERAAGPFSNTQLLASFLMVLLPIVVVVAISEKHPARQLAAQVAAVLMAACLLLTQTRSAWLGSAGGLGVLAVLALVTSLRGRQRGVSIRKHELVLPAMLLGAVVLFLAMWPQASIVLDRAATLRNASSQRTWVSRTRYAQAAIQMTEQHPVIGVGPGQYAYLQHSITGLGTELPGAAATPSLWDNAHSLWLQTAAELGVPGLLLMVGAVAAFLFVGIRRTLSMDPGIRRALLMGAIASIVAFSIDAVSNPSWSLPQVSMFFWLVMGLGVGTFRPHRRQRVRQRELASMPALKPAYLRYGVAIATVALIVLLPTVVVASSGEYDHFVRAAEMNSLWDVLNPFNLIRYLLEHLSN